MIFPIPTSQNSAMDRAVAAVQAAAPIRAAHATDAAATPATTPAAGDVWSKRAVGFMELT